MESSAVLLCLASVLLAHTLVNAAAKPRASRDNHKTDFTVTLPPECIDQEFCTIKPADYPTSLMDQEAKLLVKRSRRQSPQKPVPQQPRSNDGSNCKESMQQMRPYVVVANNTQHVVVQSGIFNQVFNGITCRSEGASCFESLGGHGSRSQFYCGTRNSFMFLTTYNFKLKKLESFKAEIPVGCACVYREDL